MAIGASGFSEWCKYRNAPNAIPTPTDLFDGDGSAQYVGRFERQPGRYRLRACENGGDRPFQGAIVPQIRSAVVTLPEYRHWSCKYEVIVGSRYFYLWSPIALHSRNRRVSLQQLAA